MTNPGKLIQKSGGDSDRSLKNSSNFCKIFDFRGVTQRVFLENSSMKILWVPFQLWDKIGAWVRAFHGKLIHGHFWFPNLLYSDHRNFQGGHYSHVLRLSKYIMIVWVLSIPMINIYTDTHLDITHLALKNNLAYVLHPILTIIDYQLLNCFLLHKEMHTNPTDYKVFCFA